MPAFNGRSVLPEQLWRGGAVMSVSRDIRKVALGLAVPMSAPSRYISAGGPVGKAGSSVPTPRKMTELLSICRNRFRWSFNRAIDKRSAALLPQARRSNISHLKPWR